MVRRIRVDDGPTLTAIRLAALSESPSAFGSTYADEVGKPDQHWTSRAAVAAMGRYYATYFAVAERAVVGIAGG